MKNLKEYLEKTYTNKIITPISKDELPSNRPMVYILLFNKQPIVLGHGKINRARIIFDDESTITTNHIKAIFVRLHVLYGRGIFTRYIINCENKEEAKKIEKKLHDNIGGNTRIIPDYIKEQLFKGLDPSSNSFLLLQIALHSSFDGISDIKKWNKVGLLNDSVRMEISKRLKLTL